MFSLLFVLGRLAHGFPHTVHVSTLTFYWRVPLGLNWVFEPRDLVRQELGGLLGTKGLGLGLENLIKHIMLLLCTVVDTNWSQIKASDVLLKLLLPHNWTTPLNAILSKFVYSLTELYESQCTFTYVSHYHMMK